PPLAATSPPHLYPLPLHDALPISISAPGTGAFVQPAAETRPISRAEVTADGDISFNFVNADVQEVVREILGNQLHLDYVVDPAADRKSTRLNSSHGSISYAVFCLT